MMDVRMVRAREGDVETILDFMVDYYRIEGAEYERAESEKALRYLLAHEEIGELWMVHSGDAPAGYFCLAYNYSLEYHGRDCIVEELYLSPAYRHRSIGSTVMQFIADHLRERGFVAVHLLVKRSNHAAYTFYLKNGFFRQEAYFLTRMLAAGRESTMNTRCRTICWVPVWNRKRKGTGLEHLLLSERAADSVVLAFDEEHGPFRLTYRLAWDERWRLREAELALATECITRSLSLRTDGHGHWRHRDGDPLDELDGCLDIDIWPTPFTNTFPIRRVSMEIGERRQFRVAWVFAPDLTVQPQTQAYTRLADRRYLFESLDGNGFTAELPVDEECIVLDYPDLFRRVPEDA